MPAPAAVSSVAQVVVDPVPSPPVISCPPVLCPGGKATLTAAPASQVGVTYAWSWDAPGLPLPGTVGPPNTLVTTSPGNFWITASDPPCSPVQSNVCSVPLDPFVVGIVAPCCACNGKPVTLCATISNGRPLSYLWTPGGQRTPCITVSPTATTTYTVTVTDTFHCALSASATVTVCH